MSYPITVFILRTGPVRNQHEAAGTPCTGVHASAVRPGDVPEWVRNILQASWSLNGKPRSQASSVSVVVGADFFEWTTEVRVIA